MKVKLDENLPFRLATRLKEFGHGVHTVHEERLIGHADSEIWAAAQKESRFLITQDMDFSDGRKFAPGSHHGILLVRLRSPDRGSLLARVVELFQSESVGEWAGCFVCSYGTQDSRVEATEQTEYIAEDKLAMKGQAAPDVRRAQDIVSHSCAA